MMSLLFSRTKGIMKMSDLEDDMEIPEFQGSSDNVTFRNGEWVNHAAKPLKNIKCIIDYSIVERVRDFEYCVNRKLGGSNEFGGYVKWHWDNGNIIVDDFMIPEQVVGGSTVDFRSEATPGYTGVFHKHPTGCKMFSGTDDNYINANHDLSILFEGGTFILGVVNIDLPGNMRFQTKVDIVIQKHENRNEVNVDMISGHMQTLFQHHKSPFQEVVRRPSPNLPGFSEGFETIDAALFHNGEDEDAIEDDNDGDSTLGF